ncbi:Pyridoxal kinase, partial [Stegodyphus mimosarum]
MEIPKLDAIFTGTGDLFSALLLAWMARTNGDLVISCERTVNSLKRVLERTLKYASGMFLCIISLTEVKECVLKFYIFFTINFYFIAALKDPSCSASMELKLIQSKNDIENPPTILKC